MMQLNEGQKQFIQDYLNALEIEPEELSSYSRWSHAQNFDRFREPDDVDWDEEEEWETKRDKLLGDISDYASAYGWDCGLGCLFDGIEDWDEADDIPTLTLKHCYDFIEGLKFGG